MTRQLAAPRRRCRLFAPEPYAEALAPPLERLPLQADGLLGEALRNHNPPCGQPNSVRHAVMTTTPTTFVRSLLIFARLCSDSSVDGWQGATDLGETAAFNHYRREVAAAPSLLVDLVDV